MRYKGRLSDTDRLAIYYKIAEARTDMDSYMLTHPNASRETAISNAYKYFRRIMAVFDSLPIQTQLKICGLGNDRVYAEINKRLNATNQIYFQGVKVAEVEDNRTRQQATELLTKITRLDRTNDADMAEEENGNTFEIVDMAEEEKE